jgi:quinol-cytochrome oxidoreductase complex cytochrome b subunit
VVGHPTLARFFSLHYVLSFVLVGVVCLHLRLLHREGSTATLTNARASDKVSFYPYLWVVDLRTLARRVTLFCFFVRFYPLVLGDADNEIRANNWVTPHHIVPEWYFLPYYARLRSIPSKVGGVVCRAASLVILFFLPRLFIDRGVVAGSGRGGLVLWAANSRFQTYYKVGFGFFVATNFLLGWVGFHPIEPVFVWLGQLGTVLYFAFFLLVTPLCSVTYN